jgi:ABC-type glycerol-3-phosphate transport system permease component
MSGDAVPIGNAPARAGQGARRRPLAALIGRGALRVLLYLLLICIAVFALFPIVYAFTGSFKPNQEFVLGGARILPKTWRLQNYTDAWRLANFARYTWNSVFVTCFVVLGQLVISSLGGYALARYNFPGKRIVTVALVATLFYAGGTITIYPLFRIARFLNIHKGLWGLIVVQVLWIDVAKIFLFMGYMRGISREIDEAAIIDGCGPFRIYWRILMPLSVPIIATITLLSFKESWNAYLLPLVFTMSYPKLRTLTVGVISLRYTHDATAAWNIMLAGSAISLIPIILIYAVANRFFIQGITAGSVKG